MTILLRKSALIFLAVSFAGCSINKFAARKTASVINAGLDSFYSETDIEFAEEAMPANLKLMEVLLENDPQNTILLTDLAKGYCGYSFMFIEDKSPERASEFYKKGIAFSLRALNAEKLLKNGKADINAIKKENVPFVFWHLFCKSSWINLNMREPDAIAELPEIMPEAEKIKEINPSFYHNGTYVILASYYAVRPRLLGGDPKKAKKYFEISLKGAGENFLMNKYVYAKIYSALVQDDKLFDKLINGILAAPKISNSSALANEIARKRALKLREKKDELF